MPLKSITARCYCGATNLSGGPVDAVAICHCSDCKRWTGAPMPAFVAIKADSIHGLNGDGVSINPGVKRWNCTKCGSPLAATFDYLADQIYLPLGIVDQAEQLSPEIHCHFDSALSWLHLEDGLPRENASARTSLRKD